MYLLPLISDNEYFGVASSDLTAQCVGAQWVGGGMGEGGNLTSGGRLSFRWDSDQDDNDDDDDQCEKPFISRRVRHGTN